ncbi:polyphosphoinositide phosphatase Fig4 [Cordyceps fumosorosea ARSEF 2679]|uniref:Polyphosphoinositide phosphatase Fig4 n=1 Tax=Cordyceps fumosorosea (strain ARSEF 2679) TaxID=1081104 RepID=A0A167NWD4_CORFA|nr:polyphosphoinositide phosphatase Fig4 [Cordyceps fumosorosea ARSEF 2679]OAA56013.1 polyphosphoinositide phosphatase Fig4 [Cordyceps fumosorosea ARSEF 2679]
MAELPAGSPSTAAPASHTEPQTPSLQASAEPSSPKFPQLQNTEDDANDDSKHANDTAKGGGGASGTGGGGGGGTASVDDLDGERAVAEPFIRTASPEPSVRTIEPSGVPTTQDSGGDLRSEDGRYEERDAGEGPTANRDDRNHDDDDEPTSDRLLYKMHKFSLYETASRYYVVGVDVSEKRYRVLKIDRTTDGSDSPSMTDDKIVYTLKEMNQLLDTIDDGNKGTGGVRLRCTTWGLLGFIRFTGCHYMLLITKKSTVAMLGGHYVYQVEGTELIPLAMGKSSKPEAAARNNSAEETRFLSIFNGLDLTRSFYYSYSYDVTHTLQRNIMRERACMAQGIIPQTDGELNSMFVWNNYLLKPISAAIKNPFDWCRPIIHGYVDQAALSIYGRTAYITVIARRSRHFAGARFLKRGANDLGYVANDVETEQIVAECQTTSFHAPGPRPYRSPHYTSYVQHRGSIPLHWTQDSTGVTPKPPIELSLVDPFYSAAALHFDDLFRRYGAPIYVLNLVKAKERQPRESKLLDEYTRCIDYLNQFLPAGKKIIHKAWDMSRASKVRGGDVIGNLETIADDVLAATGFFRNGDDDDDDSDDSNGSDEGVTVAATPVKTSLQRGVARTNCIDCLDRTNAAQFVIGKRALGHQLHALGILADTAVAYDTDGVNLFTHMWHDHGDTIAVQYGGSQLVNTMETYRKINQWTSHSRDMIESLKRYYNNSFLDSQRQEAYNLFLGNYVYRGPGQPMLWDLATDYYLHHSNPRDWTPNKIRSYVHWFDPANLQNDKIKINSSSRDAADGAVVPARSKSKSKPVEFFDDYWLEYYRPSTLSSFPKMFAFKMNSTIKYIPLKSTQDGKYDLSPFRVRIEQHDVDSDKKKAAAAKKSAVTAPPHKTAGSPLSQVAAASDDGVSSHKVAPPPARGMSLGRWLHPTQERTLGLVHAMGTVDEMGATAPKTKPTALEKSTAEQWTFTKAVKDSLNPSVDQHEADDYARYIHHPQNLPLVVSSDTPVDVDSSEYQDYVHGGWQDRGLMFSGSEDEVDLYAELLKVGENPLTVTEEDAPKKRYKAYRKWLRGKSFFKQQPLD